MSSVVSPVSLDSVCGHEGCGAPAVCVGLYEGASCLGSGSCEFVLELCGDDADGARCGDHCVHEYRTSHCHAVIADPPDRADRLRRASGRRRRAARKRRRGYA